MKLCLQLNAVSRVITTIIVCSIFAFGTDNSMAGDGTFRLTYSGKDGSRNHSWVEKEFVYDFDRPCSEGPVKITFDEDWHVFGGPVKFGEAVCVDRDEYGRNDCGPSGKAEGKGWKRPRIATLRSDWMAVIEGNFDFEGGYYRIDFNIREGSLGIDVGGKNVFYEIDSYMYGDADFDTNEGNHDVQVVFEHGGNGKPALQLSFCKED